MANKKCPNCGTTLKEINELSSVAWVCPKCGYGEATTTSDPIYDDEATYTITLLENDYNDYSIIKTISKFTGLNFIKTKELIHDPKVIFAGKAYEILEKKKLLDDNRIKYIINPDFPY